MLHCTNTLWPEPAILGARPWLPATGHSPAHARQPVFTCRARRQIPGPAIAGPGVNGTPILLLVLATAKNCWATCRDAAARHPRRITITALSLLGSFAITAFGIAPMAPDAAQLPKRQVDESLQVPGLAQQLAGLAGHALELTRSDLTRSADTVDTLLLRLGVHDPAAADFIRLDRDARRLIDGRAGKQVQVRTAADGSLLDLVVRGPALDAAHAASHFTRIQVARLDGRFSTVLETAALTPQVRLGSGTVRTSLWAATDDARLPDAIAGQLIDIFSGDIDFHRQLRKGDSFSVVFETLTADDQPVTWQENTGRILAAEFVNSGKALQAVWYDDAGKRKGAYFSFDGRNRHLAFLASPMEFSRIASGFAMRLHPIFQNWRAHNGVDYSAPAGTAVRAVGDGIVESAGRQSGYGNVVQLLHPGGKTTLYAHLSRIDVQIGQRVDQGQRVGAVGATGWATGPHLHFEFRVNGQYLDPLTVARASENPMIDPAARPRFLQVAALAQQKLDAAESLVGFRGDAE